MSGPRRTRIKFCGMTSPAEIALAVAAGADAVGVIVAESPRRVRLERLAELASAVPPFVTKVGVMAEQGEREAAALRELGFVLQFSGDETSGFCERAAGGDSYVKAYHVRPGQAAETIAHVPYAAYPNALWLFDSRVDGRYGGTGATYSWAPLIGVAAERDIVVSGGLTADNVAACVRGVRPYAVDVRNGIECDGNKDFAKMTAFVHAVREADAASERDIARAVR